MLAEGSGRAGLVPGIAAEIRDAAGEGFLVHLVAEYTAHADCGDRRETVLVRAPESDPLHAPAGPRALKTSVGTECFARTEYVLQRDVVQTAVRWRGPHRCGCTLVALVLQESLTAAGMHASQSRVAQLNGGKGRTG